MLILYGKFKDLHAKAEKKSEEEKLKKYFETKDQDTKGYKFLNLLDFLRGFIVKKKNYKHKDFCLIGLFIPFSPFSVLLLSFLDVA